MAKRACGVPIFNTCLMSSGFNTASPRHRCQPTSSMGSPLRNTICAASGSTQMVYSAAGVTLPSQHGAPPMTTQRPTLAAIDGFFATARARFVSGASVTSTTPGFASIASIMASTACHVPGGLLNSDVSGDRRDRDNADFRGAEGHDESDRIIGGGIGIDQEGAGHAVG